MSEDPVIDRSRVDSYLRSRHRVEVLNSAWKPALAGAAGAPAIIGAVVVGVWVVGLRFTYQTVVVPQVNYSPVEVPRVTMGDPVVVPNIITKNVEIPVPRVVYVSPTEKAFIDSPAFANAEIKGRIIASPDGISLAFDTGKSWAPTDPNRAADSAAYVGLRGYCSPITGTDHFHCYALLRDGTVISVPQKPVGRPT
jgi:hypothetical protein